jgi:hypothetical protein
MHVAHAHTHTHTHTHDNVGEPELRDFSTLTFTNVRRTHTTMSPSRASMEPLFARWIHILSSAAARDSIYPVTLFRKNNYISLSRARRAIRYIQWIVCSRRLHTDNQCLGDQELRDFLNVSVS